MNGCMEVKEDLTRHLLGPIWTSLMKPVKHPGRCWIIFENTRKAGGKMRSTIPNADITDTDIHVLTYLGNSHVERIK